MFAQCSLMSYGPRKPTPRPPRRPRLTAVLGDLVRDRLLLRADCTSCRRSVVLLPAELARFAGYDCVVTTLHERMVCSACGGRDVEVRLERHPEPPGAHY